MTTSMTRSSWRCDRVRRLGALALVATALVAQAQPAGTAAPAAAAGSKPIDIDLDVGLTYDDNVTRGKDPADRRPDTLLRVGAAHFRDWDLASTTRVTLGVGGALEAASRHRGLSRAIAEVEAEWAYRATGAFAAPTWSLFARAAGDDYRSRVRDGWRASVGGAVRRALTDRIDGNAALAWNVRRARSDVFSTDDVSLRLGARYRIEQNLNVYALLEARRGDLVSSGRQTLVNLDVAEVFTDDDAFADEGFLAYRFPATLVLARVGAFWRFGDETSLDVSLVATRASPREGPGGALERPRYQAHQVRAALQHRY